LRQEPSDFFSSLSFSLSGFLHLFAKVFGVEQSLVEYELGGNRSAATCANIVEQLSTEAGSATGTLLKLHCRIDCQPTAAFTSALSFQLESISALGTRMHAQQDPKVEFSR
jgi:hypothetical protein